MDDLGSHASEFSKSGHKPACPTCGSTCCHAAAPPFRLAALDPVLMPAESVAHWPVRLASWTEPVPDKPPRA